MEEKDLIGIRIRQAREELGLTQVQLAERLGIAFQSLQQWETGKTTPRVDRLRKLANVLGKTPSWLQFGVGTENLGSTTDFIAYLKTDEFKTQLCAAHASAMAQFISIGWISVKRSDVSLSVFSDLFYARLLDEFGVSMSVNNSAQNQVSESKKEA